MKRLVTAIAAAAMAFSAHAGDSSMWIDSNGVIWSFDYSDSSHNATITGASGYSEKLDIPAKVYIGTSEYSVKEIEAGAFKVQNDPSAENISMVLIPTTVRTIGASAFQGGKFTLVSFGYNVQTIGERAFYGCTGLDYVWIPAAVTEIGDYAFGDCSSLSGAQFYGTTSGITMDPYSVFAATPYLSTSNANDDWANAATLTAGMGMTLSL